MNKTTHVLDGRKVTYSVERKGGGIQDGWAVWCPLDGEAFFAPGDKPYMDEHAAADRVRVIENAGLCNAPMHVIVPAYRHYVGRPPKDANG